MGWDGVGWDGMGVGVGVGLTALDCASLFLLVAWFGTSSSSYLLTVLSLCHEIQLPPHWIAF